MNHLIHYTSGCRRNEPEEGARMHTVGIPQLLEGGRFLERLFTHLGCAVALSGPVTAHTLELGAQYLGPRAPLPARALAGQAAALAGMADVILVEQTAGRSLLNEGPGADKAAAPRRLAAPKLPISNLAELPAWHGLLGNRTCRPLGPIAGAFGFSEDSLKKAYLSISASARGKGMELAALPADAGCKNAVALLGHPYLVGDRFLNMDIRSRLHKLGFESVSPGGSAAACWPPRHGALRGVVCLEAMGCEHGLYEKLLLHRPGGAGAAWRLPAVTLWLDAGRDESRIQHALEDLLKRIGNETD